MPSVEFYNSIGQRNALKNTANQNNESTLHDDFIDSNGNTTDGNSGRLTFDVKSISTPTPDQLRVREIIEKINNDQSLNNIEERDFKKLYILEEIRWTRF